MQKEANQIMFSQGQTLYQFSLGKHQGVDLILLTRSELMTYHRFFRAISKILKVLMICVSLMHALVTFECT
jgi:hypothetical protein